MDSCLILLQLKGEWTSCQIISIYLPINLLFFLPSILKGLKKNPAFIVILWFLAYAELKKKKKEKRKKYEMPYSHYWPRWCLTSNSPQEVILEFKYPSQTGCHLLIKKKKKSVRKQQQSRPLLDVWNSAGSNWWGLPSV